MSTEPQQRPSIAPFYAGWQLSNQALVDAIAPLTPEQLALPVGPAGWQIWSIASHIAGARVYWLCHVVGELGAETTPFTDPNVGWEDDPSHASAKRWSCYATFGVSRARTAPAPFHRT